MNENKTGVEWRQGEKEENYSSCFMKVGRWFLY